MMEDDSISLEGKGILNMRVVDLKQELEKRGLSKSGSKKDLVKRLKQQLEFEKLCEDRKSGDFHLKLELDAETQQNEFVQQYLAQQQKRYAEREEQKRLEAMQKYDEEGSTISTEHHSKVDENTSSDSDDKDDDEKQNLVYESAEEVSPSKNKDVISLKSIESDKGLCMSQCESKTEILEENTFSSTPVVSLCDTDRKNNCENTQVQKPDGNQNIVQNLNDITQIEDTRLSAPECLLETGTKSLIVTECNKEISNDDISDSKGQKHFEEIISNQSIDEGSFKVVVKTGNELSETGGGQSNSAFVSEEGRNTASSCVSPEKDLSEYLPKLKSAEKMEVSDCSPVPYSLSDIQLPESPDHHVKSKDTKCVGKNEIDYTSDEVTNEKSHSDNKNKSKKETTHKLNSSQEDMSGSETKDSSYSNDSPEKIKMKKDKKHSDESSDTESDRNSSPYKKKSFKYEDTSSNLAADSDNDHSKGTLYTEQKYSKTQQNTDESDNEKSSNSEKYNHHVDSKRKSQGKCKKRESRSSSSSSSRSSDSSPERRHSKKPIVTKSKDLVQNDESNQMSDKSSDEKLIKHKKNDSATESPVSTSISLKKRLKIKRDNVTVEEPSPTRESPETSAANKNIVKKSSSHSSSDKSAKQESHEEKDEKSEINYKPRKVVLSNRKLNRKSSEDNGTEARPKKSKWESFASGQKSSHAYSISTDSLRNWFPDFKLASETSIEMEQDDHSLSAIDEKNGDITHGVSLHENESSMKQESASQMDMEDSASQEQNLDDTVDLGPVSKVIFIQNLVRPFTLNQLKDLLKQSGKIVEENFWIDKIKSKCFVMYETEKEAIKARNTLNNTRWPASNPKILSVEFSSIEELENHQRGNEPQPLKPPEPPTIESSDTLETRVSHTVEEHKRKERERRKEKDRTKLQAPVREWDKDKIIQDSPERERPPKEEKSRSAEKKEKKESKKRTEDTPAKLLDDLFQKTKSVPCIYWLPLSEEQAKAKDDEKKARELEREKRIQLKEQEAAERRNRRARSNSRRREKENRKSSTRSRSPVSRRR